MKLKAYLPTPLPGGGSLRGFTLIELLVAMAVLLGITMMVTTLVSGVARSTEIGGRGIESDSVARTFFARLGSDIDSMIVRNDVHYLFEKIGGDDDSIAFPANLKDPDPSITSRPIYRVFYRRLVNGDLSRAAFTATTSGWHAPLFTASPTLTNQTNVDLTTAITDGHFQTFGPEIIRFEFSLLQRDSSNFNAITAAPGVPGSISEIEGIVVAIAVLDDQARARFTTAQIDSLAGELDDNLTTDIAAAWRSNLANSNNPGASNVRVYQRIFLFPR